MVVRGVQDAESEVKDRHGPFWVGGQGRGYARDDRVHTLLQKGGGKNRSRPERGRVVRLLVDVGEDGNAVQEKG